jgi:cobalt transporter subunit CbtB
MKTETQAAVLRPTIASVALPILFVAILGAMIVFVAGHAQSGALHDAAHDLRHATGFPCH